MHRGDPTPKVQNEMQAVKSLVGEVDSPWKIAKACQMTDSCDELPDGRRRLEAWKEHVARLDKNNVVSTEVAVFRMTGQHCAFFFDGKLDYWSDRAHNIWMV